MSDWLSLVAYLTEGILRTLARSEEMLFLLLPMVLLIELPLALLVLTGILGWAHRRFTHPQRLDHRPDVSCLIICYSEGEAILSTLQTLLEQVYDGYIELVVVVDGATQNRATYQAALRGKQMARAYANRKVRVLPKWQRGGRVSSLNAGLDQARGELVIAVDGDTSFDNTMVANMSQLFASPQVIGAGGALRARNWHKNLLTRMQSLEYMISMQAGKTGMAHWGVINNISGAFGAFRRQTLLRVGGWDTHTAEDLDLTVRLKQYKRRHPQLQLPFEPCAVGHTDVPETLRSLILQRLRWDGDLLFLYLRKHRQGLTPRLLGWGNFLFILVYGVLQNITLPVLVLGYLLFLVVLYPFSFVAAILLVLYLIYLAMAAIQFVAYLCLISERPRQDCSQLIWLPVFPVYTLFMRQVTAWAVINETLRRSHEETSMAPWWVLKRGKKF